MAEGEWRGDGVVKNALDLGSMMLQEIERTVYEMYGQTEEENEVVESQSERLGNYYTPIESKQLKQWESGSAQPELEHLETLQRCTCVRSDTSSLRKFRTKQYRLASEGCHRKNKASSNLFRNKHFTVSTNLQDWTTLLIEEEKLE